MTVRKIAYSGMPTNDEVFSIPLCRAGEYQLSDSEMRRLRARIYSLNRDNAAGRRWRTMRQGEFLMVWRVT